MYGVNDFSLTDNLIYWDSVNLIYVDEDNLIYWTDTTVFNGEIEFKLVTRGVIERIFNVLDNYWLDYISIPKEIYGVRWKSFNIIYEAETRESLDSINNKISQVISTPYRREWF